MLFHSSEQSGELRDFFSNFIGIETHERTHTLQRLFCFVVKVLNFI